MIAVTDYAINLLGLRQTYFNVRPDRIPGTCTTARAKR